MDTHERIEALERENRRLRGIVRQLLHEQGNVPEGVAEAARVERRSTPVHEREQDFLRGLWERVDHALHSEGAETLDMGMGGRGLRRAAVMLLTAAFALGVRAALDTNGLSGMQVVLACGGLGLLLVLTGARLGRVNGAFSGLFLGFGFASLLIACFAWKAQSGMAYGASVLPYAGIGLILVGCGLLANALGQAVIAGVPAALGYYTVLLSATHMPESAMPYGLALCLGTSVVLVALYLRAGWISLAWLAGFGSYAAYSRLLETWRDVPALNPLAEFWMGLGLLTFCYAVLSVGLIFGTGRGRTLRGGEVLLAWLNTLVFWYYAEAAVVQAYPALTGLFRLAWAALALWLMLYAGLRGAVLLRQSFLVKALLFVALALSGLLEPAACAIGTALLTCAAAWRYRREDVPAFGLTAVVLAALALRALVLAAPRADVWQLVSVTLPAHWAAMGGVTVIFALAARLADRVSAPEGRCCEPALLAGRWIGISTDSVALMLAAAAALAPMLTLVLGAVEAVWLPFVLCLSGLCLWFSGLVLRSRPVEAAASLLLLSAHAAYFLFLLLPLAGFVEQPHFLVYSLGLAVVAIVAGLRWEHYLARFDGGTGPGVITSSIPALAAVVLIHTLAVRELRSVEMPVVLAEVGGLLMLLGAALRLRGVRVAAFLALALAVRQWMLVLFAGSPAAAEHPGFLLFLLAFLAAFVTAELSLRLAARRETAGMAANRLGRMALVGAAVCSGACGADAWSFPGTPVPAMLILALCLLLLGWWARDAQYRWAALFLLLVVLVQAFMRTQAFSPARQAVSFAVAGFALLLLSWFRVDTRRRGT